MVLNKLLESAVEQFGLRGFEGASTRDIARASGTAMSSITYHFGGKEGLYLAAAEFITQNIRERMGGVLVAAEAALDAPNRARVSAITSILQTMAGVMLHPQSTAWAQFIVREQNSPTQAFDRLFDGAMYDITSILKRLILAIRPAIGEREASALTIMLVGQAMVLRFGRASLCRVLGRRELTGEDEALLLSRLKDNIDAIFAETS